MTQQEIELAELDIEIAHLEALLELRNEQRRCIKMKINGE